MTKERAVFLYAVSLAATALCFWQDGGAHGFTSMLICLLIILILLSAGLMAAFLSAPAACRFLLPFAACAAAVYYAPDSVLPLIAAAVPMLCCGHMGVVRLAAVSAVAVAACGLILGTGMQIVILSVLLLAFTVYILRLFGKWEEALRASANKSNQIEELRKLIQSQRRMTKSMEHVTKLVERNRLAARIHDEIGHGMSGSILLLEGADSVMDADPAKAKETVRRVTETLRESVDEIRKVLREERSEGAEVSLAKLRNELTVFEADHPNIHTEFTVEGDMDRINRTIWTCVYENLLEALINMLKHSGSTCFRVHISAGSHLLRAEFADNGGIAGTPSAADGPGRRNTAGKRNRPKAPGKPEDTQNKLDHLGIGLQNMEERCALCYGRCFFRNEPDGFHIVMTFPLREGLQKQQ